MIDYAKRGYSQQHAARRRETTHSSEWWLPLLLLAAGILIFFSGLHLFRKHHGVDLLSSPTALEKLAQHKKTAPIKRVRHTATSEPQLAAAAKFEFYSLLPAMEVDVPDEETTPNSSSTQAMLPSTADDNFNENAPNTQTQVEDFPSDGRYYLQIVAYTDERRANQFRQNLAMNGYPAKIGRAQSAKGIIYRVYLGPYNGLQAAQQMRSRFSNSFLIHGDM